MLNSMEHEIYQAHKCLNANNCTFIGMKNITSASMKAKKTLFLSISVFMGK